MNLCAFRALTRLAIEALEALIYLSPFDDIADELWAETRASKPKKPQCDCELSDDMDDLDKHSAYCSIWYDERDDETSSPAHGSAGDDPAAAPSSPQDVEPPLGFQSMAEVADRIDILQDEVERLQRENLRLRSELNQALAQRDIARAQRDEFRAQLEYVDRQQ